MKIATLNLNGATYRTLNYNKPRLPKDLFDSVKIIDSLTNRIKVGLGEILDKKDVDIIAVQEFVNSQVEKNELKKIIEKKGYKLLIPEISGRIHFTVGFIVKNDSSISCVTLRNKKLVGLLPNRAAILDFKIEKDSYSIINMHVNDHNISIPDLKENVILLGDMNACTETQSSDKQAANKIFLEKITQKKYIELGSDCDYTWKTNTRERKLDHIFISKKFSKGKYTYNVTKDDSVNFYYDDKDKKEGFTDHSMLILDLELKL